MFKKLFGATLIIFVLCSSAYASETTQKAKVDLSIMELPITLASGKTVTLQQIKGSKPLYLKFWASYCRDCLQQMPHLQSLNQKYGDKIQIVAVNFGVNEEKNSVESIQKQFGLQMPIVIDNSGKLAKAFNLINT